MKIFNARISKIAYCGNALFFGPLLVFIAIALQNEYSGPVSAIGVSIFVLGILYAWWISSTRRLQINEKTVDYRVGFLSKNITSIALRKIESIGLHQSLLGRIFNYGRLRFHGTGITTEYTPWIKNPSSFKAEVERRSETLQSRSVISGTA
jgi:uncharacterized membrane protein YdbT with pleckstrin-like domain